MQSGKPKGGIYRKLAPFSPWEMSNDQIQIGSKKDHAITTKGISFFLNFSF